MLKRAKNRVIYHLVMALVWLVRRLPLALARACGRLLGLVAWQVAGRERRRALSNLARAGVGGGGRVVRRMFRHLGMSAIECVLMGRFRGRLGTDQSPVCFSEGSRERLLALVAEGRGVLYATAHLGNWELMAAEVARWAPVTVLAKPSYDERFSSFIRDFRSANRVRSISVAGPHLRQVLEALRKGEVVGVLLDQPVPTGCRVSFFGQPAWTSSIVARLHRSTGAPVVCGTIHRDPVDEHSHVISIHSVSMNKTWTVEQGTQAITTHLETAVRQHPEQWAWSLDRWRSTETNVLSSPTANSIPASND